MEQYEIVTLQNRILGMQRLEALFDQTGYLICQSSGERIYNFDDVVAIYIPLSPSTDQVMAVHSDRAKTFIQSLISKLQ